MASEIYPSVDGVTKAFPPAVRAAIAQAAEVTGMVDDKVNSQFNNGVKPRLENLEGSTLAINAPLNFDANSVTEQAVHNISSSDNPLNMPGPGSWNLFTWPLAGVLQQMAILYESTAPEIHIRVKTSSGWQSWYRTDARGVAADLAALSTRVTAIESKNATQDTRLNSVEAKNSAQDQAIAAASYHKGGIPLNLALETLTEPGHYSVSSYTAASQVVPTIPTEYQNIGYIIVSRGSSSGYYSYEYGNIMGGKRGVFQIEYQNGTWTSWRQTDINYYKGTLPLNTNLETLKESGIYGVSSYTAASQIVPALPVGMANIGSLEVFRGAAPDYFAYEFRKIGGGVSATLQIEYNAGVWGSWRNTEENNAKPLTVLVRDIPDGTNIDTLIRSGGAYDGEWKSDKTIADAGITGIPEGETNQFYLTVHGSVGSQTIEFYKGGIYWRNVISVSGPQFAPWVRLDQPPGDGVEIEASLERAVRIDESKQRVGGKIGTSGLPVFALRFDDWFDEMFDLVVPELAEPRNLPAAWAATVAYVETHSSKTWADVRTMVSQGVELMGHSWSHTNASGDSAIKHEIIESADYIESQVPEAKIDCWVMPGTSAGSAVYDGFGGGTTMESFYKYSAGRMILRRYPVISGSINGRLTPLIGEPLMGRSHLTIDTLTATEVIADMVKARDLGMGFKLMCHPTHIGKLDKITLADFRLILDWLVTERDAGRIEVLTPRGLAYADKSSSERLHLVPLIDNWTMWNQRAGWTQESGYITTTTGGVMIRGLNILDYGYIRGGVVEVVARVRTPTGAVVRTGITGVPDRTVDHTLPASSEWVPVRMITTIPANKANLSTMVVSIGRVSGGQVDIDFMDVRPV